MDDPVGMLVRAVTWVFIQIGSILGFAVNSLFHRAIQASNVKSVSTRNTTQEDNTQTEERRIAGCREAVQYYANTHGFIAREAISREELEEAIDNGITGDELAAEIRRRIHKTPGIFLGVNSLNQDIHIKLPFSVRDRHMYIIGKSGSGKTNIIKNMIHQDLAWGHGIGVLAPELELITNDILPYIPKDRIDEVVFINPADTQYPIPFNPLHLDKDEDIDLRVDDNLTVFKRLMGETQPRMDEILRQTLYALMERPGSTLLDIERLLSRADDSLRQEIIHTSQDEQTKTFFRDTYPMFPKDAHLPITTRIGRLVRPKAIRTFLCQPGRSFNFRKAMDEGKILLFNLSDGLLGEQTAQLLGQLIVSKIQMAVMSRVDIPAEERRPFYLYLDEFQTFTGVAEVSYEKILSRARKYKLCLIIANQQTGQLSQDLLQEILGNVSSLITFTVSHADAVKLSREYTVEIEGEMEYLQPEEFLRLNVGEAWGKSGKSIFPLKTLLAQNPPNFPPVAEVLERSRLNYGIPNGDRKRPESRPEIIEEPLQIAYETPDPGKVFE